MPRSCLQRNFVARIHRQVIVLAHIPLRVVILRGDPLQNRASMTNRSRRYALEIKQTTKFFSAQMNEFNYFRISTESSDSTDHTIGLKAVCR